MHLDYPDQCSYNNITEGKSKEEMLKQRKPRCQNWKTVFVSFGEWLCCIRLKRRVFSPLHHVLLLQVVQLPVQQPSVPIDTH